MAENKDEANACGCCAGKADACRKEAASYGETIAGTAIREMTSEAQPDGVKRAPALESEAEAFLEACEKQGEHPLDVVAHIAKREGISLSGDAPKDKGKRMIYELLMEVVKKIAANLLVYAADKCDFSISSFINMITGSCGKARRGEEPPKRFVKSVWIAPVDLGYAFSW